MQGFLADENIPPPSIRRLREAGHDIVSVGEDAPGSDDAVILAWAASAQRILLTSDRDFGELIFHGSHPVPLGVVYFRLLSGDQHDLADWLLRWLAGANPPLAGWFTVVRGDQMRRRPLP